jgi:hypothetical protein
VVPEREHPITNIRRMGGTVMTGNLPFVSLAQVESRLGDDGHPIWNGGVTCLRLTTVDEVINAAKEIL